MTSTHSWQLQEAKARLSEVVRCARDEGPQTITVRGEETAVLLSLADFEQLQRPRRSLVDTLLDAPKLDMSDEEIDALFARDPDPGRDVSFDD
jgi:prevent-host-death family protein